MTREEKLLLYASDTKLLGEEKVLQIAKMQSRDIEAVKIASESDEVMVELYEKGRVYHNDVYIFQIESFKSFVMFLSQIEDMISFNGVFRTLFIPDDEYGHLKLVFKPFQMYSIRNVSSQTEKEKSGIVLRMINGAVRSIFDISKSFLFKMSFIQDTDDRYIGVLSLGKLLEFMPEQKKIFEGVFGAYRVENIFGRFTTSNSRLIETVNYWKKTMTPMPEEVAYYDYKGLSGLLSESLILPHDMSVIIDAFAKQRMQLLKGILTAVWGIILSKHFGKDIIAIGLRQSNIMEVLPVKIDTTQKFDVQIKSILAQIVNGPNVSDYKMESIEEKTEFKFDRHIALLHNFASSTAVLKTVKNMENRRLYNLSRNRSDFSPITVSYNFDDSIKFLQYDYDADRVDNIEKLHEAFISVFKGVLEVIDNKNSNKEIEYFYNLKVRNKAERYLDIISGISIFSCLSKEDIFEISKDCRVRRFMNDENIMDETDRINGLYYVLEGQVEVFSYNNDRYMQSVGMIREKEFFGYESLLNDNFSSKKYYYAVHGVTVRIVYIPVRVFKKYAEQHSELYVRLISLLNDKLYQKSIR